MVRTSNPRNTDGHTPAAGHGELCIVLGRTRIAHDAARQLNAGSMVELDEQADEPVDVVMGGRLVARGQLIVLDGKLCVRVCELVAAQQAA